MSDADPSWRWGVAGPGGIAARFGDAMSHVDGGRIAAVASNSAERARAYADRYDVGRVHQGYERLAEDRDVDIVYVATPHAFHLEHTLLFLEAGKHVLCEKPMALDAVQVAAMVDAARSRGVFLMEAMWSRFLPSYRLLSEAVDSGRIGDVLLVEADFGFRMPVMPEHRLFDPALGGGALLDLGVYPIDLCLQLLGPVDRVRADGRVGITGVDEQVTAVLRHTRGGIGVASAAITVGTSCTARVSGSDGWIDLPAFMHCPEHITINRPDAIERIDGSFEGDGLRFEIEAVHACLDEGATECPTMPLEASQAMVRITDEIRAQVGVVYPSRGVRASTDRRS